MAREPGRRVSRVGEALLGVVADRLEHAEARLSAGLLGHEQRPVDQVAEQVDHVIGRDRATADDGLGCLERAAAAEHREAREAPALRHGEQVVAPVDQRAQRLVARAAPSGCRR